MKSVPGKRRAAAGPGSAPAQEVTLADAKEETIDVLAECFARDILTVEDFERRVSIVHAAGTMPELGEAVTGLGTRGARAPQGEQRASVEALQRLTPDVPASRVRAFDRAVAVFGEAKRLGRWIPARQNTVVAVAGSVVIDLRDALLGPGRCTFSVATFMGSVEIVVPPGLYVECAGSAVLGSFELQREDRPVPLDPDAPVLRIDGCAVLGSVEVESRRPGESKKDARRRHRWEKKEARRSSRWEKKEALRQLKREAAESRHQRRRDRKEARHRLR